MKVRLAALLTLSSLFGMTAATDGISIYPTTLILDQKQPIETLTIRNQSTRETVYELAGYKWTQNDGDDVLTLDKSFIVTPPVVTLAAGEERLVRVGLISDHPGTPGEEAYRLRISELPSPAGPSASNLNVRLQVLLPVFAKQPVMGPNLQFSAFRDDSGRVCIDGLNMGDSTDAHQPDERIPVQKYVLGKSEGRLCVDNNLGGSDTLTLGVTSAYQRDIQPYEMSIAAK